MLKNYLKSENQTQTEKEFNTNAGRAQKEQYTNFQDNAKNTTRQTLTESEFNTWYSKWKDVQMSNSANKDDMLDGLGDVIEKNLSLIGLTAIEDKLQEVKTN